MITDIYFNKDFCEIDNSKDILSTDDFRITQLRITEGHFYAHKEVLAKLECKGVRKRTIFLKMPFDGQIISNNLRKGYRIKKNDLLFTATKIIDSSKHKSEIINQSLEKLNNNAISIVKDDFTKEISVVFTMVAGEETKYFKLYSENSISEYSYFGITFGNNNGFAYIKFISTSSDFQLSTNDSIILLFDDDSTLTYVFTNIFSVQKYHYFNIQPLTIDSLKKFATIDLKKIKVMNSRRNIYDVYHLQNSFIKSQYNNEISGQFLLRLIVKRYIEIHKTNNFELPTLPSS